MIARVSGYVIAKKPPLLTVETHGIGYEMYAPMTTFFQTPDVNHYVKLHTQLIIKDDEHQLYAFANQDERYIFQLLIRVNGIGPKVALAILSGLNIRTLIQCIQKQDHFVLANIPGIGQKTAQKLMLEIADKINYNNLECLKDNQNATMHQNNIQSDTSMGHEASVSKQNGSKDEAVAALEALGYNRNNAIRAVNKVYNQELSTQLTTEDLIKYALNHMVKS